MPQQVLVQLNDGTARLDVVPFDGPIRYAQPIKRHDRVGEDKVVPYRSIRVYIIDDPEDYEVPPPTERNPNAWRNHAHECELIRQMFTQDVGGPACYVEGVRFSPRSDELQLRRYFEAELAKFNSEDLIIIYYHGLAGMRTTVPRHAEPGSTIPKKNTYLWKTFSGKKKTQDVGRLIRHIKSTNKDCLFLLDAFMPTSYPKRFKRENRVLEFIQCGKPKQDPDGVQLLSSTNFTETLTSVSHERRENLHHTKYRKWVKPKTFPELMGRAHKLCSYPLRSWTARTHRYSKRRLRRIVIDPIASRAANSLIMASARIQGPDDATQPHAQPAGSDNGAADGGSDGGRGSGFGSLSRRRARSLSMSLETDRSGFQRRRLSVGGSRSPSLGYGDGLFVSQRASSVGVGLTTRQIDAIQATQAASSPELFSDEGYDEDFGHGEHEDFIIDNNPETLDDDEVDEDDEALMMSGGLDGS